MIPTVNVRCRMFDPLGNPIAGARVTAKLTNVEIFNGYVVPEEVSAIAGPDGVATVALWPNALGATASMYTFRLTNPDNEGVARIVATIPNADCDLHLVANLPAYPGKTDGQMALEAGLVTINTQVGVATTKAGEAGSSAAAASGSASTATSKAAEATTSASDAAASALMATNKAGSATTSANTATAKATEASNSASAALASKDAAALSETNSAASKLAAATSATNAATAEANTLTYKNTVITAASDAAASETAALNAKNTAVSAAATATTKADEAATSATVAAASKTAAASSATTAQDAATAAQNAATSADATAHMANTSNPHNTTKVQVGLGNVDNTSDANKPVSTAQATAIAAKQATIAAGTTAQYYRGDKTWRDFATDVRASVLTGLSLATGTAIAAADTVLVACGKLQKQITDALATLSAHTGNTNNPHNVTKTQVGLGSVDNTSDANKPVSTAQLAALALKANAANPATNGTLTHTGDASFLWNSSFGREVAGNHRVIVKGIGATSASFCARFQNGSDIDILRLFDDRAIEINGPAYITAPYTLGYGTGSGGTATQPTNKSTAVTINKPSGRVTMHPEALAIGVTVQFAINNTTFGVNDGVILTGKAWSTRYRVENANSAAGHIGVRVTNINGATFSDPIEIDFQIIKGATS